MDEEVGRHHLIRDSLEMKLQALKERLHAVSLPQNADSDDTAVQQIEEPISRLEIFLIYILGFWL